MILHDRRSREYFHHDPATVTEEKMLRGRIRLRSVGERGNEERGGGEHGGV